MKSQWVNKGASEEGFEWTGGATVERGTGFPLEAVIGEPNFKEIWWLESAFKAARSVARVKLPSGSATGFLIGPDILMTNHHVFEKAEDAKNAVIQFNYRLLADDTLAKRDDWQCDPDALFMTNPSLDYSVVRMKDKDDKKAGEVWGHLSLDPNVRVFKNQRVNIVQHPQGRFQEIAFRDNQVKDVTDNYLQYLTDTDYGTSGSPVFNDYFKVVALHNQRVAEPNAPGRWHRNQGFRVGPILEEIGAAIGQ